MHVTEIGLGEVVITDQCWVDFDILYNIQMLFKTQFVNFLPVRNMLDTLLTES